ncbi:MAG: tetratricopeptide repeat protein, partial [Gemmatimonadota bacterium]
MAESNRDEIDKLEALYAANPDGRVFTHLAEAHRKAGELERAREILEAGLARHEDYSSAHVVLGRILMDQGENTAAGNAFRRVIELDPQNLVALRTLGDLAEQAGDHQAALGYYDELLHRDRGDEELQEKVAALRAEGEREAASEAAPPEPSPGASAYAPYEASSDGPTHDLLDLPDLDAPAGSAAPAEDTGQEDRFELPHDAGSTADAEADSVGGGDLDLSGFDTDDGQTAGGDLELGGFESGSGWGADDDLDLEPPVGESAEDAGAEPELSMSGG